MAISVMGQIAQKAVAARLVDRFAAPAAATENCKDLW
jgi:hypothetical protein